MWWCNVKALINDEFLDEASYFRFPSMLTRLLPLLFLCLPAGSLTAQTLIRGEVKEQETGGYLENVNVKNIYTQKGMTIGPDGQFQIVVSKGQLLEFSRVGYQTVRVRIANEKEPLFYTIIMGKAPVMLRQVDIRGKTIDFVKDSIRYRETYDVVLRKQGKNEIDMRSMPLAMLSKKNRQEWAFQEMYKEWEKEKYIDFVFNEKLVAKITYLSGDELQDFMKRYRPDYNYVRTATTYEYLEYIKSSYYQYKISKL